MIMNDAFLSFYRIQMIKNSALMFKDIRNVKRSPTQLSYSTSKDIISSAKQLKKARSTKQIDLTSFMENKNQKIKNIDQKLEIHHSEIQRNNDIIEQLNQNFTGLKEHLDREKEATANEERKNKLLKEEIERTNKILRTKNSKIQESSKKIGELEKENEGLRQQAAKSQEYSKTINSLRSKVATLEENISDLRHTIADKDVIFNRQKEKLSGLQFLRGKEEELNAQLLGKDLQIGSLKQAIDELNSEKSKELANKSINEGQLNKLEGQLRSLREANAILYEKLQKSEKKCSGFKNKLEGLLSSEKEYQSKIKLREVQQLGLRTQCNEVKQKLVVANDTLQQKAKQLSKKDGKIEKLTQKIKQLQGSLGDNYKQKERLKNSEQKIAILKKRMQSLQQVYYSIIPQIQCPFGHQLNNPVTIIPCGHNYCLGCKKGYNKECMQCSGKLKIEAVYRNQLMDDIIGIVGGIKQVIQILK